MGKRAWARVATVTATGALLVAATTTPPTTGLVVDVDGTPVPDATVLVDGAGSRPLDHTLVQLAAGVDELALGALALIGAAAGATVCPPATCTVEARTTTAADGSFAVDTPTAATTRGNVAVLVAEDGGARTLVVGPTTVPLPDVVLWTQAPELVVDGDLVRRAGVLPAALAPTSDGTSSLTIGPGPDRWSLSVRGIPLAAGDGLLQSRLLEDAEVDVRWTRALRGPTHDVLATSRPTTLRGTDVPDSRGARCDVQAVGLRPGATAGCAATDGDLVARGELVDPGEQLVVLLDAATDGADIVLRTGGADADPLLRLVQTGGATVTIAPTAELGATRVYRTTGPVEEVTVAPAGDAQLTVTELSVWDAGTMAAQQQLLDDLVDGVRGEEPTDPAALQDETIDALMRQLLPVVVLVAAGAAWVNARSRPGRRRRRRRDQQG